MFGEIWDLPENMSYWLSENEAPWIVNIDLDYFYCDTEDGPQFMVSGDYLTTTFRGLSEALVRGDVGVVTLCLTPDSFTAGWESVEELASRILAILDMEFRLAAP